MCFTTISIRGGGWRVSMTDAVWVELHAHSFFSLLDGASAPEVLIEQAKALGMPALALTDHDSLAGAMRFAGAARKAGVKPVFGAEITLHTGAHLTLLAETQEGYGNLCRIVTRSRCDPARAALAGGAAWPGKMPPAVTLDMLSEHRAGLIALSGCGKGPLAGALLRGERDTARQSAALLTDIFGARNMCIELQDHNLPGDRALIHGLSTLSRELALPCVATGNTHYAARDTARLRDCLIAIDANSTLTEARKAGLLPLNHTYALPDPAAMRARFAELPEALSNTLEIAGRCMVDLDFGQHRLPRVPVPAGKTEFGMLYELCHTALPWRYPTLAPGVLKQLAHELDVIERAGLAPYFLIVHDIVDFARRKRIRCSGRGSAAGSIVSYLLGISHCDPLAHNLLFERFLSDDKHTMPDIDIDFDSFRRDEVFDYIYAKYGHAHAAMVTNHVTFQARSAIRELGKVLDFPEGVIDRIVRHVDSFEPESAAEQIAALAKDAGDAGTSAHPMAMLAALVKQIDGVVRHLSIHVGGIVITGPPLADIVPVEPATAPDKWVLQWDKDSVEDAGLIKIDVLGLRTLGLVDDALRMIEAQGETPPDFDHLPLDDAELYAMLAAADTIGTFQVESRAQLQMLPRTKPRDIKDLAVEIAIIRPGPVQGGAVHPYLRRRTGDELISYPHPLLEPILKDTYGVLLFQEDCLRVAMVIAGFSAGEADQLRRAMSRSRSKEAMAGMHARFMGGAQARGIDATVAEDIWGRLAGFASYGFCRSHAAAFALIAYQTLWLKRYQPAAFYCALLNAQPMGFYSPEVIVGDMKRHGIALLPPDINASDWGYGMHSQRALRMGLASAAGMGETVWERVRAAREAGAFAGVGDFCKRTQLPRPTVMEFIRAGLFDALGQRRTLLWEAGEADYETRGLDLDVPITQIALPALSELESTQWDYTLTGLSASGHIVRHYRPALTRAGVMSTAQVKAQKNGKRVRVAGLQAVRQHPQTARGVVFVSLEDEEGMLDVVLQPRVWDAVRKTVKGNSLIIADGTVQQNGGACSVLATAVRGF